MRHRYTYHMQLLQSITFQYFVPTQQHKPHLLCLKPKPTLQQEAIFDEPDQIPKPVEYHINYGMQFSQLMQSSQTDQYAVSSWLYHNYDCSNKMRRIWNTLAELSCGVSELKAKTKLDCCLSPRCGFQDILADKQDAFLTVEMESMTF